LKRGPKWKLQWPSLRAPHGHDTGQPGILRLAALPAKIGDDPGQQVFAFHEIDDSIPPAPIRK
jgi:hypothetical protein